MKNFIDELKKKNDSLEVEVLKHKEHQLALELKLCDQKMIAETARQEAARLKASNEEL